MGLIVIFFSLGGGCCAAIRTGLGEANDLAGDEKKSQVEPTSVPGSSFAFFSLLFFPFSSLSSSLPSFLFLIFFRYPFFFLFILFYSILLLFFIFIFRFIFPPLPSVSFLPSPFFLSAVTTQGRNFPQTQAEVCTNLQAVCLTLWGKTKRVEGREKGREFKRVTARRF